MQLGNLYFDAERYTDAVQWYEDALRLNPKDANVSTDLGVAYYYTNEPDKAIGQFEQSLEIDPAHTKTMLNMGIVKAFGKQDLAGASAAWQQVIATAPDEPRGAGGPQGPRGPEAGASRRRTVRRLTVVAALLPAGGDGAVWPSAPSGGCSPAWPRATRAPGAGAARASGPLPVKMTQDPVCGTFVVPGKALSLSAGGATHWFCSERCRAEYAARS